MINVYEKYKKDIWTLFVLLLVFVLYCVVFWGRAGDIMIDCPRELYLPLQISEGKNLYTQIFSLYPPLGYLLNAFFVKIFGQSLSLFYLLGMINTFLILILVYLISRFFSKELLSFAVSLLVLCTCVISYSPTTNFLFPYSYSMVYALTCFLAGVYCLILYFKRGFDSKFLFFALLLSGFSVAFKFELAVCVLPVLAVLFIKEKSFKKYFIGFGLLILPLFLSFLIPAAIQGNIEGIKIFINNFLGFCSSPSSKAFLKTLSIKSPADYLISTLKDIFFFILYFSPLVFALKADTKVKKILFLVGFSVFSFFLADYILQNRIYIFSFLTIVTVVFFVRYCLKQEKNDDNMLLIMISLILILSSLRVGGYLATNHYGKYILPLYLVVFFCVWFPEILSKIPAFLHENYEKYIAYILIIFSLFSVSFFGKAVFEGKSYKIVSGANVIYATKPVGKTIEQTAEYLKNNSFETDRVLVLPEGLLVNYMAQRKSDDMFYQLLPNHIEILGEEKIVEQLSKNPPEFVVLSSLSTQAYGKTFFGIDYAQKIYEFINKNYEYLETFSNSEENRSFMMMVLRLEK